MKKVFNGDGPGKKEGNWVPKWKSWFSGDRMKPRDARPARFLLVLLLCLVGIFSLTKLAKPVAAQNLPAGVARLAGSWQATLIWSGSGCGPMSGLLNFTLDSSGTTNTAVLTEHGACGDNILTGQTFTILSLNSNGSGTANLSCGPDCGWNLDIQVARRGQIFNIVDVSTANPGNYVEGSAIRQCTEGDTSTE